MQPRRFKTISEFHAFRQLAKPDHPLISVIHLDAVKSVAANETSLLFDFYSIAEKKF